jgi:hypothetical protein
MACRGVHFAIADEDAGKLLRAQDDASVMDVVESIETAWDKEWLHETDTAWEAIHRCVTDGKVGFDNGDYPWSLCILGGRQLHSGDDYIVSLKSPTQVADVAGSLRTFLRQNMRDRYFSISDPDYAPGISDEDFEYTWNWFEGLPEFFSRSAAAGRHVIFTVNQ